jgi:uncharacterized repeat protein (TIGR01451 family)
MLVLNGEVFYERRATALVESPLLANTSDTTISITGSTDPASIMAYFPDPNKNPVTVKNANTPTVAANIYTPTSISASDLYVRSEYAPAYGLDIEKRYRNISADTLHAGDRVQVEITIKNTSLISITNLSYLDTIPQIFTLPTGAKYRAIIGGQSRESDLALLS